jgi:nicotinate-nucleotide--dimethylbenzimidazole phosphoribosyltransferase
MQFNITPLPQSLKPALFEKIQLKTKPLNALGTLEGLALQIGLVQESLTPQIIQPTMLVFAGDHGIASSGVSAYPQVVTAQMVQNFMNGGAAINVFTRQHAMKLYIVDSGVNAEIEDAPNLIRAKIGHGTKNFLHAPAMTELQCSEAVANGAAMMEKIIAQGCNVVGFGEMGIGNTASASCLMSLFCDLPIENCVGRGTGLDDVGLHKKIQILKNALDMHHLNKNETWRILATFGGFEIAMMAGAILKAAEKKIVIIIDGFICSAALLFAHRLAPNVLDYCVFSHCSDEAGHQKMLDFFNAKPLLQLNLRLGEGTGAALAYPLLVSAVNFLNDMASFASAHVSQANV